MASERRKMFYQHKKQETTEMGWDFLGVPVVRDYLFSATAPSREAALFGLLARGQLSGRITKRALDQPGVGRVERRLALVLENVRSSYSGGNFSLEEVLVRRGGGFVSELEAWAILYQSVQALQRLFLNALALLLHRLFYLGGGLRGNVTPMFSSDE
ncbi:hypothetical protein AAG570_005886 [Ranatra chinensis]|uniref:Uncharacterized protein n=1 Tax=Ranatra chinensis TaxID=642074 RepID=A0ABD0XWF9_9HEMI